MTYTIKNIAFSNSCLFKTVFSIQLVLGQFKAKGHKVDAVVEGKQ